MNNQVYRNNSINNENITPEQQIQKQKIIQAFKIGSLSFRSIKLPHEANYLNNDKKAPRPVYLAFPEIPVAMRTATDTLGIVNPVIYAAYKANASTHKLIDGNTKKIDELAIKCIADTKTLIQKMQEQGERIWEVYPYATSGHLKPDGTFSLPKLKQNISIADKYKIKHSELLTVGYEQQQIKCYCISKADTRNITEIILAKQELENKLELTELPIAVYSEDNGSLQVFFVKELITNFEQLSTNENLLVSFSYMLNISTETLISTINRLPIRDKIDLLQFSELDNNVDVTKYDLAKQAINIVADINNYNVDKLSELITQGLKVNIKMYYKNDYVSLIDILILTEIKKNRVINKNIYYKNHAEEALFLFAKLVLHGCPISYMTNVRMCLLKKQATWIKTYFICSNLTESIEYVYLFNHIFDNNYINLFILSKKLEQASFDQIQVLLIYILEMPLMQLETPVNYQARIILLFSYGANLLLLKDKLIDNLIKFKTENSDDYSRMYASKTPKEVLEPLMKLYNDYQTGINHFDWQSMLAKAEKIIAKERQKIGLVISKQPESININSNETSEEKKLQFLVDAFKKPPVFKQLNNDDETIFTILQHYYRRPGPERVIKSLYAIASDICKNLHSSSHAIRAHNNIQWYIELLEKFELANFSTAEKALLQLAIIYTSQMEMHVFSK